jgi:hypothetical protein
MIDFAVTFGHLERDASAQGFLFIRRFAVYFPVDLGGGEIFAPFLMFHGIAQSGRFAGKQQKRKNEQQKQGAFAIHGRLFCILFKLNFGGIIVICLCWIKNRSFFFDDVYALRAKAWRYCQRAQKQLFQITEQPFSAP